MPLSEGLAGDPGFGGDVADRAAAVDTFTQSATTFRGQRSIRVGHRRVLSEFGALLGRYTPHPEDSSHIKSTRLSPTSRYRTPKPRSTDRHECRRRVERGVTRECPY